MVLMNLYVCSNLWVASLREKSPISMLDTSKNVLFAGHNHLLPTLSGTRVIIKVKGHQYRWLAGG